MMLIVNRLLKVLALLVLNFVFFSCTNIQSTSPASIEDLPRSCDIDIEILPSMSITSDGIHEPSIPSIYQCKHCTQRKKSTKGDGHLVVLAQSEDRRLQRRAKRSKSFQLVGSSSGELEVNKKEQDREKEKVEQDLSQKMYEGKIKKQIPKVYSQSTADAQRSKGKIAQEIKRERRREWYRREYEKNSEVYKNMVEGAKRWRRTKALEPENRKKFAEYSRQWKRRKREQDPKWHQKECEAARESNLKRKMRLAKDLEAKAEAISKVKARNQYRRQHNHKAYLDSLAKAREKRRKRRDQDPEWAANERKKSRARAAKWRQRNQEEASLKAYLQEITNEWAQEDTAESAGQKENE